MKVQSFYNKARQAEQQIATLTDQRNILNQELQDKNVSLNSLSGALLQIAKQGISTVRGTVGNCPAVRLVGGVSLAVVIWQARNQSMHFEEGNLHHNVIDAFTALEHAYGQVFSLTAHPAENLAFEVIKLLAWDNYATYLVDMDALL